MKEIRTQDAVGHILCHDITQIIKDQKKGVLFKKGHIVREEDIPALLSVGKEHLFVWEKKEGILHENEAAEILYKISAGEHMHGSDIKEGKIELIADCDGVVMSETSSRTTTQCTTEMRASLPDQQMLLTSSGTSFRLFRKQKEITAVY